MTALTRKRYLAADVAVQSLLFIPTALSIFVPVFALFGLIPLGAVQLLSAALGAIVLTDRIRGVYFGSALAYLAFGIGMASLSGKDVLPDWTEPWFFMGYLFIAVVGAVWYYSYTIRDFRSGTDQTDTLV